MTNATLSAAQKTRCSLTVRLSKRTCRAKVSHDKILEEKVDSRRGDSKHRQCITEQTENTNKAKMIRGEQHRKGREGRRIARWTNAYVVLRTDPEGLSDLRHLVGNAHVMDVCCTRCRREQT